MIERHRFVLHPGLVASAAARGETIEIVYSLDGNMFEARTVPKDTPREGGILHG